MGPEFDTCPLNSTPGGCVEPLLGKGRCSPLLRRYRCELGGIEPTFLIGRSLGEC